MTTPITPAGINADDDFSDFLNAAENTAARPATRGRSAEVIPLTPPHQVTVPLFLQTVLGKHAGYAVLANVCRNPKSGWDGFRVGAEPLDPKAEQYFARGVINKDHNATPFRSDSQWVAATLLVVDDVGDAEKEDGTGTGSNSPARVRDLLGEPSYVIMSSAASAQYGYLFTHDVIDAKWMDTLHLAIDAKLYGGAAAGGRQVTQWMRLPSGFNTKPERHVDGKPWPVTLTEWHPERRYDPAHFQAKLADVWGVAVCKAKGISAGDYPGPRTDEEAQAYLKTNATAAGLHALGNWGYAKGDGFMHLKCAWVDEHSGGDDTAVFNPATGVFDCKHSHGSTYNGTQAIKARVQELVEQNLGAEAWKRITDEVTATNVQAAVDAFAAKPLPADPDETPDREPLMIDPGRLAKNADEVRALMRHPDRNAYKRHGYVGYIADSEGGRVFCKYTVPTLAEEVSRHVAVTTAKGNPGVLPENVCRAVLEAPHAFKGRTLTGFSRAPIIHDDGSLTAAEGFNEATGVYVHGVPALSIPETPTDADAKAAYGKLREFLCSFPYGDRPFSGKHIGLRRDLIDLSLPPQYDEAAGLALILTAVARPSIDFAPMFVNSAPATSGTRTGKGLIFNVASLIAHGSESDNFAWTPGDPAENTKALVSQLLAAPATLLIDEANNADVFMPMLQNVLTQKNASARRLGLSEHGTLSSRTLLAIAGNGLTVRADLATRCMPLRLDARVEIAGDRKFDDDIAERAANMRAEQNVLTQKNASARRLGLSEHGTLSSRTLLAIAGNGLTVRADLATRCMPLRLDARVEIAGDRKFDDDIAERAANMRAELLGWALTILRWGLQHPALRKGRPMGGFDQWTRWVRDPLLMLGCPDIVDRVIEAQRNDSSRNSEADFMETWYAAHGTAEVAAAKVHTSVKAHLGKPAANGRPAEPATPAQVSQRLRARKGTRAGGWSFEQVGVVDGNRNGVVTYRVVREDGLYPDRPGFTRIDDVETSTLDSQGFTIEPVTVAETVEAVTPKPKAALTPDTPSVSDGILDFDIDFGTADLVEQSAVAMAGVVEPASYVEQAPIEPPADKPKTTPDSDNRMSAWMQKPMSAAPAVVETAKPASVCDLDSIDEDDWAREYFGEAAD